MILTPDVEATLETLKRNLLLDHKFQVVTLIGWKTEDIVRKPWFGKSYTEKRITALYFKSANTVGTKYWNIVDGFEIDYTLPCLSTWRKNFVKMKNDLDKFGFAIKSKQHCKR